MSDSHPSVPSYPWARALIGALLWLGLSIAAGFVWLAWLREYGSILQPLVGAAVGAVGALSHVLLLCSRRFRSAGFLWRVLCTAGVAILGCVLVAIPVADSGTDSLLAWVRLFATVIPLPVLVLSFLVSSIVARRLG